MKYITGQIIRETAKAILVSQSRGNTDGGDLELWLPKSQTSGYEYSRDGQPETYIIVEEWLAEKNRIGDDCDHPVFGLPIPTKNMKSLW